MSVHDSQSHPSANRPTNETQAHDAWDQLFDLLACDVAKRLNADAEQAKAATSPAAHISKSKSAER